MTREPPSPARRLFFLRAAFFLWTVAPALYGKAWGVEPFCPGGSNPDPGVIFCDDFETGNFSLWPGGKTSNTAANTDIVAARPFMGRYSHRFKYGELGAPGYMDLPSFQSAEEIRIRFYILFDELYHWGLGSTDHALSPLFISGGVTCTGGVGGLDLGPLGPKIYRAGGCNGIRFHDLSMNMGTPEDRMLRNNKWYRIELHVKLNTIGGCADQNGDGRIDPTGKTECDGVYEIWIDGVQVAGYYTLNFRGNDNPDYRLAGGLWNHYYRTGGQTFNGRPFHHYRDNLVIMKGGNGGKPIGPATDEPALGTPDMTSPYKTEIYKEWVAFDSYGTRRRPSSDCAWGQMGPGDWFYTSSYSTVTYVSTTTHNGTVSHCASAIPIPAGGDSAMEVKTFGGHDYAGAGGDGQAGLPNKTHVMNGWIYLDPASFPAPNGAALAGMIYYGNASRNYISLGVDSENHPVLLKQFSNSGSNAPAPAALASNVGVAIAPGAWHQFELRAAEGAVWSLLLNGAEVLKASPVDDAALWARKDSEGAPLWAHSFGISDHMNNPGPLTAYYDDMSWGNTSFQDCFGWNPATCPFAAGSAPPPPDTQAPAKPKGLRIGP
ncbi:MAG: hypothetical protein HY551_06755 [Elusimicrobia bacterium]|nr:hypothetical protein [Elusimicrobiota bacterium]